MRVLSETMTRLLHEGKIDAIYKKTIKLFEDDEDYKVKYTKYTLNDEVKKNGFPYRSVVIQGHKRSRRICNKITLKVTQKVIGAKEFNEVEAEVERMLALKGLS